MNQKQREYAMARVSAVRARKVEEIKARHTIPAVKLSLARKAELVVSGGVPAIPHKLKSYYTDWPDAFDFSAYERDEVYDKDSAAPLIAKVNAEADRIHDNIMLGDAEEALSALRAFEEGVFNDE